MTGAFSTRSVLLAIAGALLVGCATPDAPDFRGRWQPLNQFAETPQAIPLHPGYVYQASPVDGTLKGMLGRWARDSKLGLSYLHSNDYTLHAPLAQIRTYDIQAAVVQVTSAYASEGVGVSVEDSRIVVRPVRGAGGTASPDSPAAD